MSGKLVLITGLPCSGKTTLALSLLKYILKKSNCTKVIHIDGDEFRNTFSYDLDYCRDDRYENIKRLYKYSHNLIKKEYIVICSFVAPFDEGRKYLKRKVTDSGGIFKMIYLGTSIKDCVSRDSKGMYQKAIDGVINNFTGINQSYEIPDDSDINLYFKNSISNKLLLDISKILHI